MRTLNTYRIFLKNGEIFEVDAHEFEFGVDNHNLVAAKPHYAFKKYRKPGEWSSDKVAMLIDGEFIGFCVINQKPEVSEKKEEKSDES